MIRAGVHKVDRGLMVARRKAPGLRLVVCLEVRMLDLLRLLLEVDMLLLLVLVLLLLLLLQRVCVLGMLTLAVRVVILLLLAIVCLPRGHIARVRHRSVKA